MVMVVALGLLALLFARDGGARRYERIGHFVFRFWFVVVASGFDAARMPSRGAPFPIEVTDSSQKRLNITEKPRRVVSLAPYVSEMLLAFGREKVLVGLTRQDLILNSALRKKNVGGYFCPDIEAIEACRPDLIIASPRHKEVIRHFRNGRCNVMVLKAGKIEEAFAQMELMGRLFDCKTEAEKIIKRNRDQLALVKGRLAAIPADEEKTGGSGDGRG